MGFACKGHEVFEGGDLGKRLESGGSHEEATAIAEDRSKSATSTTVTPAATLFTEVALDFGDAKAYQEIVDLEEARAADLQQAVMEGQPTVEITRLTKRSDAEVQEAHGRTVRAKVLDRPGRHRGTPFAPGDYVVLFEGGDLIHVPKAEFSKSYRVLKAAGSGTDKGKE